MEKEIKYKITKKGYKRSTKRIDGKFKFEHVIVWEAHNGQISEGMQVHHKDGNKLNNDISNLELLTPLEHKRYHEGCYKIDNIWYKPCKV